MKTGCALAEESFDMYSVSLNNRGSARPSLPERRVELIIERAKGDGSQ
jgi:hypothetical protein